ncbi:hypothetical protein HUZ48_21605 [Klebsiella quasipneumoniae]|nr:hypothetical protein HUZ48_21605 [Klebsiella quasipneumoniae]
MMPKARTRNGRGRSGALRRGVERTVACDRLAIGYGLVPNIETELLFGCATAQEAIQVNRWQQTSLADIYAAGEYTGFGGSELALAEGEIAGYAAAGASQQAQALFARRARWLYGWPLPQPREPLSPARAETLIALARLSAEP